MTRLARSRKRTPRLDIQRHNRLSSRLALSLLLLCVLRQSLLPDPHSLRILLFVVRAEEIDLIIVIAALGLLLLRRLGRVDCKLRGLRAVGGVLFRWVARKGGELGLEGGDVLVPAVGVRVLLDGGWGLDGLVGLDVCLGGAVASPKLALSYGLSNRVLSSESV